MIYYKLHSFWNLNAKDTHRVLNGLSDNSTQLNAESLDCHIFLAKDGSVLIEAVETLGQVVGVIGYHGRAVVFGSR